MEVRLNAIQIVIWDYPTHLSLIWDLVKKNGAITNDLFFTVVISLRMCGLAVKFLIFKRMP